MKNKLRFLNLYKRSVDIFNNKINYTSIINGFRKIFSFNLNNDTVNIKSLDEDNNTLLNVNTFGKNGNIAYEDLYAGNQNIDYFDESGENVLIKTIETEDQSYTNVFTYDEEGSMYVGGFVLNQGTDNSLFIDGEKVIDANNTFRYMVLIKYDKDGNHKWTKNFLMSSPNTLETDVNNRLNSICCDKNGSLYLTGYFNGKIGDSNNNIETLDDNRQVFFMRLNYDGEITNIEKTVTALGESAPGGTSIVYDDINNNVYLSFLTTSETVTYDNVDLISANPGTITSFILKLTPSGSLLDYKVFNTTERVVFGAPHGLTFKNGYLYTIGETSGTTNFGTIANPEEITCIEKEAFIVKYDSDFNFQWVYNPESGGTARTNHISIDENDNIYASIYFVTSITINATTYTEASSGVVVKLDENGQYVWDYFIPEIIDSYASTINNGKLYITGRISDSNVDIDTGVGTELMNNPGTATYAYIIKIDPDTGLYDGTYFTIPRTNSDSYLDTDEFNNMYIRFVSNTIDGPVNFDFTGNTQTFELLGTTANNYNGMLMKLSNEFLNP